MTARRRGSIRLPGRPVTANLRGSIDEARSVPWHMGHPGRVLGSTGPQENGVEASLAPRRDCASRQSLGLRNMLGGRWPHVHGHMGPPSPGRLRVALRTCPDRLTASVDNLSAASATRQRSLRLCASRLMLRDERGSRFPFDLLRPERRLTSHDDCGAALLRLGWAVKGKPEAPFASAFAHLR